MLTESRGIAIPKALNDQASVALTLAAVPGCFNALITIEVCSDSKYGYTNLLLGQQDLTQLRMQVVALINQAIPRIDIEVLRLVTQGDKILVVPSMMVISEEGVLSVETKVDGVPKATSVRLHGEAYNYLMNIARNIEETFPPSEDDFVADNDGPTEEYDEEMA